MPTVDEVAAVISGCSSTDEAVTACQAAGWAAVAGDGPLWPRVTVEDETFCDLLTGILGTAGPVLRRWYVYQADGAMRVQVPGHRRPRSSRRSARYPTYCCGSCESRWCGRRFGHLADAKVIAA